MDSIYEEINALSILLILYRDTSVTVEVRVFCISYQSWLPKERVVAYVAE